MPASPRLLGRFCCLSRYLPTVNQLLKHITPVRPLLTCHDLLALNLLNNASDARIRLISRGSHGDGIASVLRVSSNSVAD